MHSDKENIENQFLASSKYWVKPSLVTLDIKSTFNDQQTCANQNKFTGTDETLGPSNPPINCGPSLS